MKTKEGLFQLASHGSTMKGEVLAGSIGFFTIVYIVVINALILAEAGIPFEGAVFATILASFVGCLVMEQVVAANFDTVWLLLALNQDFNLRLVSVLVLVLV